MNATINTENKHFPVLLDELISIISPHYGGTFIDCTFGQGGYSKRILQNKRNKIIALDRDKDVIKKAENFKFKFGDKFKFFNLKFSEIDQIQLNKNSLKGIIFDLGYSTNQINDPEKGLSFFSKKKLNMRMGFNKYSADEVVNKLEPTDLYKVFKFFGEEKKSKIIANKIANYRRKKNIETQDLVSLINSVKKNNFKIHNATKIFQALRIFVNQEISELVNGLVKSFKILPIGGIMVVVTFNSIEDKIVKFFFNNYSKHQNDSRYFPSIKKKKLLFQLKNKKPIVPSIKEINQNNPSRSAKLRYGFKINNSNDFEELYAKFGNLLDIEKLGFNL